MKHKSQRRTVLVIEEDESLLQSLGQLMGAEYYVLLAGSAETGLELARSRPVQVILSSCPLRIDEPSGIPEAARLIYTGETSLGNLVEVINSGRAWRILARPWQGNAVLGAVDAAIQAYDGLTSKKRAPTAKKPELERAISPAGGEVPPHPTAAQTSPVDDLLAITSHDLRSPLATIQSAAELLGNPEYAFSENERRELAQIVGNNATHLIALVNDMLDLAKIESGKMELDLSDLLLSDVAQQSVKALGFNAKKKDISLSLEVAPGEIPLKADRLKLYRVMNNLLSNAIKFTPEGGGVKVWISPDEGGMQMQVTDSGLGIAKEDLPVIFDKYRQSRTRSTAGEKGTGLGLTIVKQLVELHGGRVEVASELGHGSTFTIHIPHRPA